MEFSDFLNKAQQLPVLDTRVLTGLSKDALSFRVQISRWVKSGKLIQLKRAMYLLAPPYRKIFPSQLYIASVLKSPSYISLEKAFEFYDLIPERVIVNTSVTTKRPEKFETPAGRYEYQHVKPSLFWGYTAVNWDGQTVFMATPEKALLDFFYLRHVEVSMDYLIEMRLQNVEVINIDKLVEDAKRFKKKNLLRIAQLIIEYIKNETQGTKTL